MAYPRESLPLGAAPVTVHTVAGGDAGLRQKVGIIRREVDLALRSAPVVQTAAHIVAGINGRNRPAQVARLRQWLADHLTFLPDPLNVETFRTPLYQLQQINQHGTVAVDCDDAALLAAALAKAIGLSARLVLVGFRGPFGPFEHIYTEVNDGRTWREMDVTSESYVQPTRRWTVEV